MQLLSAVFVLLAVLIGNAVVVSRQSAHASGTSLLHVDGQDINVRQDGPQDAPALVLLHGLGGSTHWWDPVVPQLAKSYSVIRVDLLGFGHSAKPAGDGYRIPQQGHRIGAVLDQLRVTRAVVVGHSTGGSIATALAEQRPDLVDAVALIGTGPSANAFISQGITGSLASAPVIGQLLWKLRTDSLIRRSMETGFSRSDFTIPQQLVDDVRRTTFHAFTATSEASEEYLAQGPLPDRLAPLDEPLLVIFGKEDRRWRSSSAEEYHEVPGAQVKVLAGLGHSPMQEDPATTASLLLEFVRSVEPDHA